MFIDEIRLTILGTSLKWKVTWWLRCLLKSSFLERSCSSSTKGNCSSLKWQQIDGLDNVCWLWDVSGKLFRLLAPKFFKFPETSDFGRCASSFVQCSAVVIEPRRDRVTIRKVTSFSLYSSGGQFFLSPLWRWNFLIFAGWAGEDVALKIFLKIEFFSKTFADELFLSSSQLCCNSALTMVNSSAKWPRFFSGSANCNSLITSESGCKVDVMGNHRFFHCAKDNIFQVLWSRWRQLFPRLWRWTSSMNYEIF